MLSEWRREFHQYAETAWHEIRTTARIAEILENMGYIAYMGPDVIEPSAVFFSPWDEKSQQADRERALSQGAKSEYVDRTCGLPGVIAEYNSGRVGPTIAFRFDIDALPYDESDDATHQPVKEGYRSENGCVHACGHDGHTAIGLGVARALMAENIAMTGKIRLIFQPAEEHFYGAQSIVDKGHLNGVDYFFALHLAISADNAPLPSHALACGCNDFLSVRQLDVHFKGIAAHPCGASQEGRNALLGACSAALNLHSIAPHEKGLTRVNVGEIHAGTCANTIADHSLIKVEYRGQEPEISEYLHRRVLQVIEGAAKSYGLEYEIVDYGETPAAKSDLALMELVHEVSKNVAWFEQVHFEGNVGGSDDAANMMIAVQKNGGLATYIGIGTDTTDVLHGTRFDFDEDALFAARDLCIALIKKICSSKEIG